MPTRERLQSVQDIGHENKSFIRTIHNRRIVDYRCSASLIEGLMCVLISVKMFAAKREIKLTYSRGTRVSGNAIRVSESFAQLKKYGFVFIQKHGVLFEIKIAKTKKAPHRARPLLFQCMMFMKMNPSIGAYRCACDGGTPRWSMAHRNPMAAELLSSSRNRRVLGTNQYARSFQPPPL